MLVSDYWYRYRNLVSIPLKVVGIVSVSYRFEKADIAHPTVYCCGYINLAKGVVGQPIHFVYDKLNNSKMAITFPLLFPI